MTGEEKQREMDISQLGASLETVYTAFCDYCATDIQSNRTPKEFATEIYDKGWRVSEVGDMCCQKCAKTHIK